MSMQGGKGMRRRKSVDLTSSTHASNSSLVPASSEKDVKCPRRKLIELLPQEQIFFPLCELHNDLLRLRKILFL